MGIHLTKIYTKSGDKGSTMLPGKMMVDKDSPICELFGEIDELNSHIGLVRTHVYELFQHIIDKSEFITTIYNTFKMIQNDLFDIGCIVSMVHSTNPPVVNNENITIMENCLDMMNDRLMPLNSFVLPGGGVMASHGHIARTVCRRVERHMVAFMKDYELPSEALVYINRLSDFLFVFSRWILNKEKGIEYLWETPLKKDS